MGLDRRKLTFHALRHDYRDALRKTEIEASLSDYLMGHAQEGVGARSGAGRPSLARLRAAIAVRSRLVSGQGQFTLTLGGPNPN